MISFFDVRVWDCSKIKYKIVYKLLIINILYYYYTHYYLSNYLFKLKTIINNSIWLYYPCSAITNAYFTIRHPYLKITLPYWKILDLCWKKYEICFCVFEIIAYLCIRTSWRRQLGFTSCCNVGCLSGGGGATSWKIITSVCCYSELL